MVDTTPFDPFQGRDIFLFVHLGSVSDTKILRLCEIILRRYNLFCIIVDIFVDDIEIEGEKHDI